MIRPILGSYIPETSGGVRLTPRNENSSIDVPNLTPGHFPTTIVQEQLFVFTASQGLIETCLARLI